MTLVIREIAGSADDPELAGRRRDPLEVGSEEAPRRRLRGVTAGGIEVALDLPRGSFLSEGTVLHDDGEGIIVVERKPEPALVVRLDPSLPTARLVEETSRVGHWAGNQHLLLETVGTEIRIRITAPAELMLRAIAPLGLTGAEVSIDRLRFARETAPTLGHGHD